MFIIECCPNTICAGVYCVMVCTVACSTNMVDAKIPSQGLSSFSTISCSLNVFIILPIVCWTLSNIELAYGFLEDIGFTLIL